MQKLLLVMFLAIFSNRMLAQHFQLGIKAGANISNFTGGNFTAVEKKALVGIHAGPYFQFRFAGFSLQPELLLSTQGAMIDSVAGSYKWKLTYINVPVMFQYYFTGRVYLEAGPQVGFTTNQEFGSTTFDDFAKDLDLSAAFGFGIRGKSGLGLGARYTMGISTVGNFKPPGGIDPDFKNSVFQFSIYVPLASGK